MSQDDLLSVYQEIACLDERKAVLLVQHRYSRKLYVKKVLSVYTPSIYRHLQQHPIPGMPRIEAVSEENGRLTVIEEYIAGDSLREISDVSGILGEEQAVTLTLQLCRIVETLHEQNPPIIHRDIKPENLILSPDGKVKLLDVNAAKWFDAHESKDTRLLGTVGYAAPEQYGFASSSVQTDIYGIGVLLNTLLTGYLPAEKLYTGRLQDIIKKCTELSPEYRYGSVRELEAALQRVCAAGQSGQTKGASWHRFLPPGFRTGNASHILLALAGYGFLFFLVSSITVKNASARDLLIDRICITYLCLSLVLLNNDYLGIHKKLFFIRSNNLWIKLFGLLLYDAAILVITVVFILIIESL